jgi:hypothetical protein
MRVLAFLTLLASACSSTPDELVIDCGMSGGPESWFRCTYMTSQTCGCGLMVRDGTGEALVCVPGDHADWGMAADRVIRERTGPGAIGAVRCERVGSRPGGGALPEPTIIVGASVGATGGDWPATDPQADDCVCE